MTTRKKSKVVLIGLFSIVAIAAVLFIIGSLLPDTGENNKAEKVVVERGKVISTTRTTGRAAAENEILVPSPATSLIEEILKEPGDYVEAGDIIVKLNTESVEENIERMRNQLEVRKNNLEKTRLNIQSSKLDMDYNEEVKRLRVESLESQLADQEQLLEVGGISAARVEKTRQDIAIAENDLNMLIEKNSIRYKQMETDEKGLMLQIQIDERSLANTIELRSKMEVRAPSSGIVLNIAGNIGQRVNADATLIQISDISSFKLVGSIDKQQADQLKTGASVTVILENDELQGRIGTIAQADENGNVKFDVHLAQSSHPKLTTNQTVEIIISNIEKDNILRIKKLPAFEKGNIQYFTVIQDGKKIQKEITLGIIGNDYCEVLSGLNEGDVILAEN